jgi:hypothetical protein
MGRRHQARPVEVERGGHMSRRTKGRPIKGYDEESLPLKKKTAKGIVKDFCLPYDISKELTKRIDEAETVPTIDRILKEARSYL